MKKNHMQCLTKIEQPWGLHGFLIFIEGEDSNSLIVLIQPKRTAPNQHATRESSICNVLIIRGRSLDLAKPSIIHFKIVHVWSSGPVSLIN
jgi:hypothetical protein